MQPPSTTTKDETLSSGCCGVSLNIPPWQPTTKVDELIPQCDREGSLIQCQDGDISTDSERIPYQVYQVNVGNRSSRLRPIDQFGGTARTKRVL